LLPYAHSQIIFNAPNAHPAKQKYYFSPSATRLSATHLFSAFLFLQTMPAMRLLLLMAGALLIFTQAAAAQKFTVLNKGLLFIKKENVLLTSSNWVVTIDVDLNSHSRAIINFISAQSINSIRSRV
jgi:hypothetical protein